MAFVLKVKDLSYLLKMIRDDILELETPFKVFQAKRSSLESDLHNNAATFRQVLTS